MHQELDAIADTALAELFRIHPFESLEPAPPSPLWPGTRSELRVLAEQLVEHLVRGTGSSFRGQLRFNPPANQMLVADVDLHPHLRTRAYYGDIFSTPSSSVSALNKELTFAVHRQGGAMLNALMLRALLRVQKSLGGSGNLVLKGSRPVSLLLASQEEDETGVIKRMAPLFSFGDMDAEILIDPSLPPDMFDKLHAKAQLAAMAGMVWFKSELDRTGIGEELARAASSRVRAADPCERRSFLLQRLFRPDDGPSAPPPIQRARSQHVQLFSEVSAIRVGEAAVETKVPASGVYCSGNTLHFLNNDQEVHFSLIRCMLSFRRKINNQRLHAELLDVSIPRQRNSQLKEKWKELVTKGTTALPNTNLRSLPLEVLFSDTLKSVHNNQQHKAQKRSRRLKAFSELFDTMGDGRMVLYARDNGIVTGKVDLTARRLATLLAGPCPGKLEVARMAEMMPLSTLRATVAAVQRHGASCRGRQAIVETIDAQYNRARREGKLIWRMEVDEVERLVSGHGNV